jgi:hypothetical protein
MTNGGDTANPCAVGAPPSAQVITAGAWRDALRLIANLMAEVALLKRDV